MRDEGDDPHPDVHEWVDEEESELSSNFVARSYHLGIGEGLAAGIDEAELGEVGAVLGVVGVLLQDREQADG